VTFGIKKQLRSEQGIPALEEQSAMLETEKAALELELQVATSLSQHELIELASLSHSIISLFILCYTTGVEKQV